ncbi:crossover junction endodeoxyribonuclease RuvC [Candidatus Riesia pediculicola]|uniref:Crossover junction endodeoxyribonuclease RuvC n=1 Tax=Riesia pediculicola (strain USDA) TaxID=515618 RepID=D4G8A7_RIEPU|nr:crossover junction endodeoxyribonuclease RuvC [Candidatus Riesia pediculicola]ADD79432.1 crossover junction endodeoxyribonuclease RuvC [Candidatus Riesia pediculicola USDA]ARC53801.1 crossover junction endodeoxyribonuclease RuvC [Candidatus Riesia pediculicola]QOJ86436.1 crossover junction endodeoxyribonuclease RuvC [Candidatus Riesia pediculicola]
MITILGIDPGSCITGYGIVQSQKKRILYIDGGCIKNRLADMPNRLKTIYDGVQKIIHKYRPDIFAVEQIFVSKNVSSALKLSQAKAVAILAAVKNQLPIFEYSTKKVRKSVVGTGSAKKEHIQYAVHAILKLSSHPQSDIADALAVAIAHIFSENYKIKKKRFKNKISISYLETYHY